MIKKVLKVVGALLLLVIVGIGGAAAYIKLALPNVGPAPQLKIESTPALLARGASTSPIT